MALPTQKQLSEYFLQYQQEKYGGEFRRTTQKNLADFRELLLDNNEFLKLFMSIESSPYGADAFQLFGVGVMVGYFLSEFVKSEEKAKP